MLYPIYNELLHCVNENVTILNSAIEILYSNTVGALVTASESCIPRIPKQSLKFWWSTDLTNLKKQSIISHKIWEDAGKPISGSLFMICMSFWLQKTRHVFGKSGRIKCVS